MALAYLLDPCIEHQNRAGVNNVNGYFEVYLDQTDDHATVYTDFNGTLAPEHIGIDNNGRCVMVVDSDRVYRVEMREPNGALVYSQYPVWTQKSGGGVSGTVNVMSTDGSIAVDSYDAGGVRTYDLSTNVEDSAELLNWIRTEGCDIVPTNIYKPHYAAGTMAVGEYGVQLDAGQYYHVTSHVKCTKVNTGAFPWVDDVRVRFRGRDRSTGDYVDYRTFTIDVDYSLMLAETYELSIDVMPETDVDLVVVIDDKEIVGGGFELADMEIHRVYSGAPRIPGGVQPKLTAGSGITIDSNNVISATGGGGGGATYTAGNGINISSGNEISVDTTVVATTGDLSGYQPVISDLETIRSGAAAGATAVQPGELAAVAVSGSYNDLLDKPTIPPGVVVDQVYDGTSTNAQSGTAVAGAISGKQDTISDLETIRSGAAAGATAVQPADLSGYATTSDLGGKADKVTGATNGHLAGLDSNGNLTDSGIASTDVATTSDLSGKQDVLTAGSNISIDTSTNTISATDTTYTFSTGLSESSGTVTVDTSVIQPKLTAGSNVTISNNTISATDTNTHRPVQLEGTQVLGDNTDPLNFVAGSNVTITNSNGSLTIAASGGTFTQQQANWNETDTNDPSYIQNKPTIPVVPAAKELTAGSNIAITESASAITVSVTGLSVGTVVV